MNHLLKIILTASVLVIVPSSAMAGDLYKAKFSYDRSAPVQVTYANFLKTAKKTCRLQSHRSAIRHYSTHKKKHENTCERSMMDQVITETESPKLIALHHANKEKNFARSMRVQTTNGEQS